MTSPSDNQDSKPDQPKQYREWWTDGCSIITDNESYIADVIKEDLWNESPIRVIEHSAFEELQRQYDELHSVTSDEMSALAKQVEELRAEIDDRIQESADLERVVISVRAELQWSLKNEAKYKDELAKAMAERDTLKAELAKLKSDFKSVQIGKDNPNFGVYPNSLADERDALTSTCARYRAALERIEGLDHTEVDIASYVARQALEPEGEKK